MVKDSTLKDRTVIGIDDIILLLEFCLKIPISPSKASSLNRLRVQPWVPLKSYSSQSIYGVLRAKSPKHCTPPPRFWCRYVDDTFVIHKEANKQGFLQHINSVDPAIKFTVEDNKEDGSIPFLDTTVKPEVDGSLSIYCVQEANSCRPVPKVG